MLKNKTIHGLVNHSKVGWFGCSQVTVEVVCDEKVELQQLDVDASSSTLEVPKRLRRSSSNVPANQTLVPANQTLSFDNQPRDLVLFKGMGATHAQCESSTVNRSHTRAVVAILE